MRNWLRRVGKQPTPLGVKSWVPTERGRFSVSNLCAKGFSFYGGGPFMIETLHLEQYVLPEGISPDDSVVATYLFRSREKDILQRVATMAAEQTTGTWIQVPGETTQLKERHQGKVLGIWEVPDYEADRQISGEERTQ